MYTLKQDVLTRAVIPPMVIIQEKIITIKFKNNLKI